MPGTCSRSSKWEPYPPGRHLNSTAVRELSGPGSYANPASLTDHFLPCHDFRFEWCERKLQFAWFTVLNRAIVYCYCSMSDYLSGLTGKLVSGVRSGRDKCGSDRSSSESTTGSLLGVIKAAALLPCAARRLRLVSAEPVWGAPCMIGALLALDHFSLSIVLFF